MRVVHKKRFTHRREECGGIEATEGFRWVTAEGSTSSDENAKPCATSKRPTQAGCQTTFCARLVRDDREPL